MAQWDFEAGFGAAAETATKFLGQALQEEMTLSKRHQLDIERDKLQSALNAEAATKGREQAHKLDVERLGITQAHDAAMTESRNRTSLAVANIGAASARETTQMNIKAMEGVRKAEENQAIANTERLNLGNAETRALTAARNDVLNAKTPEDRIKAEEKFYYMNPDAAQKLQAAALDAMRTKGLEADNNVKFQQENARQQLLSATTEAEKNEAQRKLDLYDSVGAENRARTEGLNAQNKALAVKAQIDETTLNLRRDILNATSPEARVAAQRALDTWEYSPAQARAEIAAWQAQAKLAETALNNTSIRLQQLRDKGGSPADEKVLVDLQEQYAREVVINQKQAQYGLYRLNPNAIAEAGDIDVTPWITDPKKKAEAAAAAAAAAAKAKQDARRTNNDPLIVPGQKKAIPSIGQRVNRGEDAHPRGLIDAY